MTNFFIIFHATFCMFLIVAILMQSGRGGGLTEGFAPAESIFGAKTNEFMVRTTVVLASLFLVTSLTLAYLSAKKEQSLIPAETKVETKAGETQTEQGSSGPDVKTPAQPAAQPAENVSR